jgi:DNA primase catalytic subunit
VYVVNDSVRQLAGEARRQIVDYLQAKNLDIKSIIRGGATLKSTGWRGRLAKAAYEYVGSSGEKKFKDKDEILRKMSEGNYDLFRGAHSFWDRLLNEQVIHLGSAIDQSVTIDLSRLIRLPSTIHGGSSLLCMAIDDIDKFNPFKDAVVFYNYPEKIKLVKDVSEFVLREQTFGPFKAGEEKSLPEYAALYLVCKEAALPLSF